MVISIPAPTAVICLVLLLIIGILAVLVVQARHHASVLRLSLDVARQRQQDDERELTQRSALDTLKDEFVSTVSHELRTPLTSIRGALGLLSSGVFGNLDVKSQNLLRIALTNTDRLIRLINDLLDLERMDSGAAKLQMKRCSLPDLVNQTLESMGAIADAGSVRLVIAPAAKALLPNIFFDADPDRIMQVLTNLFSNAIKFAPPSSSVTFEVETPPDELIFRVVDQGRGIPEDQLESIFERFKQVDHPDAKAIGGTGLGLAICRSIIQQHGGSIWAQRNLSRGASICIRLPRLQRTYDTSVANVQPMSSSTAPSVRAGNTRNGTLPEATLDSPVLICDDHDAKRALVVMHVRSTGHSVLEAASSKEALDMATNRPTQSPLKAILLDLQMTEMRRWELLKSMAANRISANVPLVCLSMGSTLDPGTEHENSVVHVARDLPPSSADHLFADLALTLRSERGPGRVLLIEDHLDSANIVLAGFANTDILVEHAATSYRAMALCRERKPDLLVLDLTLPGEESFAFIEWLMKQTPLRSLPLVVYSRPPLEKEEQLKARPRPTEFLTKAKVNSQDMEKLLSAIAQKGRAPVEEGPIGTHMAQQPGVRVT